RCSDAECTQPLHGIFDILARFYTQAKMMQPGCVRLVSVPDPRRTQHVAEVAIEVLDVRITVDAERVLAKLECLHQHAVIKRFGDHKVRNRDVDVVDADDFGHASSGRKTPVKGSSESAP